MREVHIFPVGSTDHDVGRCWCQPDWVLAEDAETGERMSIVTHAGTDQDAEITEVAPGC